MWRFACLKFSNDFAMPFFDAELARVSNLWGDVYWLDIWGPSRQYILGATIAPQVAKSHIAEPLARAFGLSSGHGTLTVVIRQVNHRTLRVHEFDPIQIAFRPANPRVGPNFILLGWDDLADYFDVYRCDPPPTDPAGSSFCLLDPFVKARCHQY